LLRYLNLFVLFVNTVRLGIRYRIRNYV